MNTTDHSVAELRSLRLSDLEQSLPATRDLLLEICAEEGIFYLDVDDPKGSLTDEMEYLMGFSKRLFDISGEEKERYQIISTGRPSTSGFKAAGTETGEFGKPDGFELYMLPYNELMIQDYAHELICPQVVKHEQAKIAPFTRECHRVGLLILEQLSEALVLANEDNLATAHDPLTPSTSSMTFLKYPPNREGLAGGHISHTDIGTLTFLYSLVEGLQIFRPETEKWLWVQPRWGHLVVNVGDSLRLLTGKRLKSCLHRVIPHADARDKTRYSYAYFMRPNEKVVITMGDGRQTKSIDWHLRKTNLFSAPIDVLKEQKELLHGGL